MMLSLFDVALILIIFGFTLFGFWFGIIQTLGSAIGTILGAYFASRWYDAPANWLTSVTGQSPNFARVVAFIVVFLLITRLVGLVFRLIDSTFGIILRFPLIKTLNRFLGAALGFAEGVIMLGLLFYFISKFPLSATFMEHVTTSKIVPFVTAFGAILWPLVPEAVQKLQSYFNI